MQLGSTLVAQALEGQSWLKSELPGWAIGVPSIVNLSHQNHK